MSLTNNIRNTVMTAVLLGLSQPGHCQSIEELEARVDTLKRALGQAEQELAEARDSGALPPTKAVTTDGAEESTPTTNGVRLGPITLGGAVRVNYVYGDYETQNGGPSRGGEGGNVELDTFRINATLDYVHWSTDGIPQTQGRTTTSCTQVGWVIGSTTRVK